MEMSLLIVLACAASAPLLGWYYDARYMLARPPLGVINGWDICTLIMAIIMAPVLYLSVPRPLAATLLGVAFLAALYTLIEPVLRTRWAIGLTVLALAAADIMAARSSLGIAQWATNDLLVLLAVIGIATMWTQGGMSPRALAVLASFLAIYDPLTTIWLPVTGTLMLHLDTGPFAPLVHWGAGDRHLSIGIGDLLVATAYPLVMRRAFGTSAGATALALACLTLTVLLAVATRIPGGIVLPVLAALGPVIVVHCLLSMPRLLPVPAARRQRYDGAATQTP
jgi:hypothetical protein